MTIKAEYIDHMGNDLRVVNAARVSFDKESQYEFNWDDRAVLKPADAKLLDYLSDHNHFTPFTHCVVTMRETVPIFVARQRFKHTVGFTYNEVSRRYVDSPPEFHIPDVWRGRPDGSMKQGSGDSVEAQGACKSIYFMVMAEAKYAYTRLLELGVCPEQARMVLPQNMVTSYYVTGSLSAWARAYKLRSDPHSQKEIQLLADKWNLICNDLFPVSWEALTK